MAASKPKQKNQTPVVTYFIIFILGFLTGVGFTIYKTGGTVSDSPATNSQQSSKDEERHQNILKLEAEVTANPEDFQAWRQLGNLYYDHNEPEKAIAAYSKSLEFHSGDANILTDLGVMYRRTKQPQKAIESLNKAIQMEPTHEPARFNKGIVLLNDLNKPGDAIATWEELLKINPQARTGNGESIRDFINNVKAQSTGN
jgi:cytochrome c-type biogenesis protein CcmH/NrfG